MYNPEHFISDENIKALEEQVAKSSENRYRGTHFVYGIGGKEFESSEFEQLFQTMIGFARKGIYQHLAIGQSGYNNRYYEKIHGNKRPMIDGVGPTEKEDIEDVVIPANQEVLRRLKELIQEYADGIDVNILGPRDISGPFKDFDRYKYVASVKTIRNLDIHSLMNIATSIGVNESTGETVNVNKDEFLPAMVGIITATGERVSRVFNVTSSGGVEDQEGQLVGVITDHSAELILQGKHPYIRAEGGMLKKLDDMHKLVQQHVVNKATLIGARDLGKEIYDPLGAGTAIVHEDNINRGNTLKPEDYPSFDLTIARGVRDGLFRPPKDEQELNELRKKAKVDEVDYMMLGWASKLSLEGNNVELAKFFANYIQNGIGTDVLKGFLERAAQKKEIVWAITGQSAVKKVFEKANMKFAGHLKDIIESGQKITVDGGLQIPESLLRFSTEEVGEKSLFYYQPEGVKQEIANQRKLFNDYDEVDSENAPETAAM